MAAALGGEAYRLSSESGVRPLQPGTARGVLYGGCLSLLTASLGTRFAAQTEGKLLFLEDLAEKPYQIDRMLRQMKLAGKLEGVTGIIFGEMLDCASPGSPADLTERVILTVLEWFSGPIAYGLRSGHVSRGNVTLTAWRGSGDWWWIRKAQSCGWARGQGECKRGNEDRNKAYTSDRYLRHGDGVARGHAATQGTA